MKKLLILFLLLGNVYFAKSQAELNVFKEWSSNAGSQNFFHKNRTKTDGSGNVYVAGATVNGSGNYDILVAKYNSSGVQQWVQQYNGYENYHDFATAVFVDASGNVYITGTVSDSSSIQGSDIITNKYNSSGTLQWSKRYNGSGNFYDSGADIIVDGSGNVYITGGTYTSTSLPYSNAITIKYNSSGTQQWATLYNNATYNLSETGAKIIFSGGTKVSVAGAIQTGLNTYSYGRLDYSISTGTQSGGVILGTGTSNIDYVGDFVQDNDKNTYIAGATYDSVGSTGYNYYIMKLDSTLAMQWERTYNGASNLDDMANGIKVDPWGNVYVTGYSTSSTEKKNIVTRKYNSAGSVIWTQTYNDTLNGDDAGMAMAMDASGNICIAGYDSTVLGSTNYLAIKYDTSGAQQWIIRYDGMKHLKDMATDVCIDDNGDFVVTGMSETAANTYEYITIKYVEKIIITPTDAMGEEPASNFLYYENKGQLISTDSTLVPDVKFYTNNTYPSFYFKNDTISMVFSKIDTIPATNDTLHRIDMAIEYSEVDAKIYPMKEQRSYLNYFLTHCTDGVTGVFGNQQLVVPSILNKIDLIYTSNQNGIKLYFVVSPGADPTKIGMLFNGASSVVLDTTTQELALNTGIGTISFDQPFMYQIDANNDTISGSTAYLDWLKATSTKCYFTSFPAYNTSELLIIEVDQGNVNTALAPSTPEWGTFLGGSSADYANEISTDHNGSVYVVGTTTSVDFPSASGFSFQPVLNFQDAFIAKFDYDYSIKWRTYYGGDDAEWGYGIAYDNLNEALYVCGNTQSSISTLPTLNAGGYNDNSASIGGSKCFIVRFSTLGFRTWATRFGDNLSPQASKLAVDINGNMYIVGTISVNGTAGCSAPSGGGLPLCNPGGAYMQSTLGGSYDGFIAKFNSSTQLVWSTLFGGNGHDIITNLALDNFNQKLYAVGRTSSTRTSTANCTSSAGFPLCDAGGYFQADRNGAYEGFVSRFTFGGTLEWSSFFGGQADDAITGVSTDNNGVVYVTGKTATNFYGANCSVPVNNGFPKCDNGGYTQSYGGGASDAFIAKFDLNTDVLWSTFLGGDLDELGNSTVLVPGPTIVTDESNKTFVFGMTTSGSSSSSSVQFPTANNVNYYNQLNHAEYNSVLPSKDCFIMGFDNDNRIYSTYFGGEGGSTAISGDDESGGIATYQNRIYICGKTKSTVMFPLYCPNTTNPYCQGYTTVTSTISDGFVAQLTYSTVTDIEEQDFTFTNNTISVYPNPSDGEYNVSFYSIDGGKLNLDIVNMLGETIQKMPFNAVRGTNLFNINIKNLADGLYFIKLSNSNDYFVIKIVKQ